MVSSAGVRDRGILGPAARNLSARGPDLSQLKTPIRTSLSGTKQVIHALECATGEVKEYLLEEINLMYECKTCFSVFRSIANLVAHKRTFCKSKYKDLHHVHSDQVREDRDVQTVVVEAEPVECVVEQENVSLDNYAPSLELMKTAGILEDISNKPAVNRLLPPGKTGINTIVNKLRARQEGVETSHYQHHQRSPPVQPPAPEMTVHLEPIYETENCLMQSWRVSQDGETVGETYRAWQEAEQDKQCFKVWPNGHVTSSKEIVKLVTADNGDIFSVRVPVDQFASIEDIDSDDEDSGYIKYPCPTCRKTYSKIMNVFKHMVDVHDISLQEAKAKRKMITNQSVVVEGRRSKKKASELFSRPVKPVLVKLKNYKLDPKVSPNLCDKLSTANTTTCPILTTSCLSDSTRVQARDLHKAEALNRLTTEREEREREEDGLDEEVNRKLMEFVNRRRVECRLCGEQFSRTYLLKNHIADHHLKLRRWTCKFCEFGSWSKYQCVNHAVMEHKYRNIQSAQAAVVERTKEEYLAQSESGDEQATVNGDETQTVDIESPSLSESRPRSATPQSSSSESPGSEEAPGGKRKRSQLSYNVRREDVKRTKTAVEGDSLKMVFSKVETRHRPGPKSRTRQYSPSPATSRESSVSNLSELSEDIDRGRSGRARRSGTKR